MTTVKQAAFFLYLQRMSPECEMTAGDGISKIEALQTPHEPQNEEVIRALKDTVGKQLHPRHEIRKNRLVQVYLLHLYNSPIREQPLPNKSKRQNPIRPERKNVSGNHSAVLP